ncbi:MAG: aldo/keto reductase, partial [Lachnospiraceae bacterium]|nr:aldo/keto reductase [Lachnospiraceae bacterium]
MKYRKLQNAGVEVSQIAVGTWAIGGANYGPVNDDDSIAAIRKMLELGVNVIDTAPVYGWGYSEKI